jgi:protease-4
MKIDAVKELADGRVYTANQAKKNGLVDAIGTWDEALTYMENECFDGEEIFVEDFEYEPEMNFYRYFMGTRMKSAVEVLPEAVEKVVNPKLKYPAFIWEQ